MGIVKLTASIVLMFSGAMAQMKANGRLKVFVLAGQSNMEGHGFVDSCCTQQRVLPLKQMNGTLPWLLSQPQHRDQFKHLVDASGKYAVRQDVFVSYKRQDDESWKVAGGLTVGQGHHRYSRSPEGALRDGSWAFTSGPEIGFGTLVGDYFEDPVLLVKTAWGGRDLVKHFRPPTSAAKSGVVGPSYLKMLTEVDTLLADPADIKRIVPAYDPAKGYEMVGFLWHQGFNDHLSPDAVAEYAFNLGNLIRDLRAHWKVPGLLFSIAESGMVCHNATSGNGFNLCQAQAVPAADPEFKGKVGFVPTKAFYDATIAPDPSGGWGYHWNGSFWSYYNVGKASGESMVELVKANGIPPGGVVAVRPRRAVRLAVDLERRGIRVRVDGRSAGWQDGPPSP